MSYLRTRIGGEFPTEIFGVEYVIGYTMDFDDLHIDYVMVDGKEIEFLDLGEFTVEAIFDQAREHYNEGDAEPYVY